MKPLIFIFLFILLATAIRGESVMINQNIDSKTKDIGLSYSIQPHRLSLILDAPYLRKNLMDVSDHYFRAWISDSFSSSVTQVYECVSYNYTNYTKLLGVGLSMGLTPIIAVPHSPDCMANNSNIGRDSIPPRNLSEFGDYMANISAYYDHRCNIDGGITFRNSSGEYFVSCGNWSDWGIEIWNEPDQNLSVWFNSVQLYPRMYQIAFEKMRAVSTIRIGTASGMDWWDIDDLFDRIPQNDHPNFVSTHKYGGTEEADFYNSRFTGKSLEWAMNRTEGIYYYTMKLIDQQIKNYNQSIPLYNHEWNVHPYIYYQTTLENGTFGATYAASAFYWMLLSNLSSEAWFYGTTIYPYGGYGLWDSRDNKYPVYYTFKNIVKLFKKDYPLFKASTNDSWVETISVHNATMVINKHNRSITPILNYSSIHVNYVTDIDSGADIFRVKNVPFNLGEFSDFQVKFYKYGMEPYKHEDNSFDGIIKYNPGYLNITAADYDLDSVIFEWKSTNYTIIDNGEKALLSASNFTVTTMNGSRVWNISLEYNTHDLEAGNYSYSFYLTSYDNNKSQIYKHNLTISKVCAWNGIGDFVVDGQTCVFNDPYLNHRGNEINIEDSEINIQAMPKGWKTMTIGSGSKVTI